MLLRGDEAPNRNSRSSEYMWVTQAQASLPLGICLFPTIQPSSRRNDGDAYQLDKSVDIHYKKEKIVEKVLDQDTMYIGGVT